MSIVHTRDLDALFFARLDLIAHELGARPADLLAVMYSESGVRADAWNDNPKALPPEQRWNASGINQMMPATLAGLGWTRGHAAFRALSATEQLEWVRRYLRPFAGRLGSVGAIYTANFLPALVSRAGDPAFVLTARGGPLGWAYAPNAALDANGDYAITVAELEGAVRRACVGPRWAELLERLGAPDAPPATVPKGIDLGTTLGLQRALSRLGYAPGDCDGIPGPRTRAALLAFQGDAGLAVDGIPGPRTRAALEASLAALP